MWKGERLMMRVSMSKGQRLTMRAELVEAQPSAAHLARLSVFLARIAY